MMAADHHLLSKVGHQTKLIFWISGKNLSPQLEGFKALDYLTNGLITHTLGKSPVITDHLFLAEQFNQPLYIYFSTSTDINLNSLHEVIKSSVQPEDTYLVWGDKTMSENFLASIPPSWRERCFEV